MKVLEGKVEAISIKNRGIKVNGTWFNFDESFLPKIRDISKGDYIRLEVDDFNNVLSIEVLEKPLEKEIKIELLKIAIEIYKIYLSYTVPKVDFETAEGRDMEYTLQEIKRIYDKIREWILS